MALRELRTESHRHGTTTKPERSPNRTLIDERQDDTRLPLIRCRECDSKLLQLERIWLLADGRRVAHRRCPECGTRDSVTVGAFAMKLWLAREERLRSELSETAAELAGGAEVPAGLT
jgi:DNA-directed RNA polymerase subunit RPC12/RpoP